MRGRRRLFVAGAVSLLLTALALSLSAGTRAESVGTAFDTVSAGAEHTCGIRSSGDLACWGDDSLGQLDGIPSGHYVSVSAGDFHTCAIDVDRKLACWGDDSSGQLDEIPSGEFLAVSAGGAHSCAIRAGGVLACWGDDSLGQLDGIPSGHYVSVSAGGAHSCATRADHDLACWGDDSSDQVSDAPRGHWYWHWHDHHHHWWYSPPRLLAVSAGGAHSCGGELDNDLECWGDDSSGQLDEVPSGDFTDVSAGATHSCAIRSSGELACWGDDSSGQLDDVPPGEFLSVSAGGAHSCAVRADGARICWGSNESGQAQPELLEDPLGQAMVGEPYSHQFETTPQAPAPQFHVSSGALPNGLKLGSDGKLTGSPTVAGKFTFTVAAANGVTPDAEREETLKVVDQPPPPVLAAVDTGLPDPTAGVNFNVDPIKGVVKVKCSRGGAARISVPTQVPLACQIDTNKGTAKVTTSKGNGAGTQSADFWGGAFSVAQDAGHDWDTELHLAGRLKCEKRKATAAKASKRRFKRGKKGRGRKLWGSGKGNYSTSGSYGSASVVGTTWLVADRCNNSTLIAVREGTVWVEDFVTGKTPVLKAGESYVAKAAIPSIG